MAIIATGTGIIEASAQSEFEVRYAVSMTGIPIGKSAWTIGIGTEHYRVFADGSATGLMSLLTSGRGSATTEGAVTNGRMVPRSFMVQGIEDGQKTDLRMTLNGGIVTALVLNAVPHNADRIPITEAHMRGVVDPLTALLIASHGSRNLLDDAEACNRTLPIFDGRRRYDLALWFKRVDVVKADFGLSFENLPTGQSGQRPRSADCARGFHRQLAVSENSRGS